MAMPTFADAEAAIAARDYRAALSILEALDVVGEDACYRRDIQPPVAAAYRTMLRRVRTVLTNAWKGAGIAALCCGLFYLFVARGVFPGARWGVFLLYVAAIVSVYFYVGHQIATFNRTLPRGVRLTFMRLCTRFTELGGRVFLFMRVSLISGFFLIAFMNGIG